MFPPKLFSISAIVAVPDSYRGYIVITQPGEQKPHCVPLKWASVFWIGWKPFFLLPMPSTVYTDHPWHWYIETRHWNGTRHSFQQILYSSRTSRDKKMEVEHSVLSLHFFMKFDNYITLYNYNIGKTKPISTVIQINSCYVSQKKFPKLLTYYYQSGGNITIRHFPWIQIFKHLSVAYTRYQIDKKDRQVNDSLKKLIMCTILGEF